jgi:glycosyltransferase involved in cell wall biosynthesis
VSIITPTYNHEKFIGACIESVLSQTYRHWEQIILDDGSTDGTGKIIQRYTDSRIRYIRQENRGIEALAENYNRALSLSKGDLVAILEGDDIWPMRKLSTMVPVFQRPEVALAFGESHDMDENGVVATRRSRTSWRRSRLPEAVLFNDPVRSATGYLLSADGQTFIPPSTVLIRREPLESIGGFQHVPGTCPVDVPTFAKLSLVGKFHYFHEVLGYRRHHLTSATVQFLRTMTNTARGFALNASADPSFGLTSEQRNSVEKSWTTVGFASEFWLGRICLINRETKQARRHFSAAIGARDARVVLASAIGWGLSWLRSDMEGLARLVGRATFSETKT